MDYACCIPYLREDDIDEAMNNLNDQINETANNMELILFMNYMRNQWQPLKKIISVFGTTIATNNVCEQYHRKALDELHKHTGKWIFIGN